MSRARAGAEACAIAHRCHAEACLFAGRLSESRRGFERAAKDAGAAGAAALEGQILVGWIGLLGMIGEPLPQGLIGRAERLLAASGDRVYLGKLFMNLGNVAYSEERYAEADAHYDRATNVFERAGLVDATWAGLLINRGIANTHLSRIGDARALLHRAREACQAQKLPRLAAQAELNLAYVERLRGDYRATLRLLGHAGETFHRVGARDMVAATDRARAEAYLELSMAGEAEALAASAREAFAAEGMTLDATLAGIDEAEARLQRRRPADALPLLEDALRYFTMHRSWPRRATTLLRIARVRLSSGDPEGALTDARRALRSLMRRKPTRGLAEGHRIVAVAHLNRGRLRAAAAAARRARLAAARLPAGVRGELDGLAGRIAIASGERARARAHLTRAISRLERHRLALPGVTYRANAFEGEVRVHLDRLDLVASARTPDLDELLRTLERSRAQAFRDRAAAGDRRRAAAVDDARARVRALTGRVEALELDAKVGGGEWVDTRRRLLLAEGQLLSALRATERDVERRGGRSEARIPALMRRTARGQARVHYFLTDRRVGALVVTREGASLVSFRVPPETLIELVTRVRFHMNTVGAASHLAFDAERLVEAVRAPLRTLDEALVSPLRRIVGEATDLRIVPHGILHAVPFECLVDEAGRHACERWRMTRAVTAFPPPRRRTRATVDRPFVAGTVTGGPPLVSRELEAVARRLRGAEVVSDPESEALLHALATRSHVHLCAHGTFRSDNPMFSRLALRDDSLFVADVVANRMRAELVVLSACQTARTHAGKGDDLVGVTHALLAAGARRVVGSLWVAHDEATLLFMDAFYASFAADGDAAGALAAARGAVRARWPHPFHWSAFGLYEA